MAEEYYSVSKKPVYSAEDIRKIRNEDPVNAERIINPIIEHLIQNTHAVKLQTDSMDERLEKQERTVEAVLARKTDLDENTGKLQEEQLPGHAATHASGGGDPIAPESIGAVPATRKINSKALSADISLTAADVGAAAADHGHSAAEVGVPAETAAALGLTGEEPTVDEALAAVASASARGIQIATGNYTGTGTFGQSNPNSLSFDFEPDVVFVFTDNYVFIQSSGYNDVAFSESFVCFLRGGKAIIVRDSYVVPNSGWIDSKADMPYAMNGTGLSWYNSGSGGSRDYDLGPRSQMNASGTVYHYLAIGRGQAG